MTRSQPDLDSLDSPAADLSVITTADTADIHPAPDVAAHPSADTAVPVVAQRGRVLSELPLALVIAGTGVGLIVIALHHFRWGSVAIASSVLGAAFFRLVLPTRRAGMLVVRSRFTDIATTTLIGGSLMLLALVTRT
jgi:hypothetical protein